MKETKDLNNRLWAAAEQLRANGSLKLNEIAEPILGLIFLKFADLKFKNKTKELVEKNAQTSGRKKPISKDDYVSSGVLYIPEKASFEYLLTLPESENIGKEINEAIKIIEQENAELSGVLPNNYSNISNKVAENSRLLLVLLKSFNQIPETISGDAFGEIYEFFLGEFARSEGQKGGEFFTPQSIVKLIVEILEPYNGKVFDPACGSAGMFVASAKFVKEHSKNDQNIMNKVQIFGQEKGEGNVKIAKMNLAIHGLSGKIDVVNSFYEDSFNSVGKFDYVLANPPFNVKGKDKNKQIVIDEAKLKDDARYNFGLPLTGKNEIINGNYLWIQMFASCLSDTGRAGFVMSNAASDAGNAEGKIREKLVNSSVVDCIVSVGPNMFLNATLPCTLWFFDKRKKGTDREKKILFINATEIYTVVDRAHNTWSGDQIIEISEIVKSYREEEGSKKYKDVKGLCKVATIEEVQKSGFSLNPGRYVGTVEVEQSKENFTESMQKLQTEFLNLTKEAHTLEKKITENFKKLNI